MYTRFTNIVHLLAFSLTILCFFENSSVSYALDRSVISQSTLKKYTSISGLNPGEQFGNALNTGDFNGDGILDIVATAPFYSDDSGSWKGNARILWGPTYDISQALTLYGSKENDQFGTATTSIDINNDGIDDLVVSAYQSDSQHNENTGSVYVFLGDSHLSNQQSLEAGDANIHFFSSNSNSRLGIALSHGDFNGDSIDDLVMSAPGKIQDSGRVYVMLGGFEINRRLTLNIDTAAHLKIIGSNNELFGSSLTLGDFNGDSLDDLAIGAYLASNNSIEHTGKVYLISGRNFSVPDTTNIQYEYDLTQYPELAQQIVGQQENEWFGFSLNSHNINQDNFDDLIIGSFMYLYQNKSGKASIFHGVRDFMNTDFVHKANQKIIGDVSENLIGSSIGVGDINKNLSQDLILGAPGIGAAESSQEGIVYMIPDMSDVPDGTYHLPNEIDNAVFTGQHADDWYGGVIHTADLNGDGFTDVIVGAPNANTSEAYDVGRIEILYGETALNQLAPELVEKQNLSRGDAVNLLVDGLNLKEKYAQYLSSCESSIDFCMFTFAIQSTNPDLSLADYLFYSDVPVLSPYFENVKVATMLNLIHGYFKEQGSPFKPNDPLKRIEALKVLLGAIEAVDWKYRFEIKDEIDLNMPAYAWWYPRYLLFAEEKGIIEDANNFRPDENISRDEFIDLLDAVKTYRDSIK